MTRNVLTKAQQELHPFLAFGVGTLLSVQSLESIRGWDTTFVDLVEKVSGDNKWIFIPLSFAGHLFYSLAPWLFFRSFIDDNDGIGDLVVLGCISGYILAEYLGEGIFVDFGVDGHKLLNLFVVAWTFFTLVKNYRKNVNRRVAVTVNVVE